MAGRAWRVLAESYAVVKGLARYRETLFWVIVFPLLFYGISILFWANPEQPRIDAGVYNGDACTGTGLCLGDALVHALNESGLFELHVYHSEEGLAGAVRNGTVSAGIAVPRDASQRLARGEQVIVRVYVMEGEPGGYAGRVLLGFLSGFEDNLSRSLEQAAEAYLNRSGAPGAGEAAQWLRLIVDPVSVEETVITPPLMATPEGARAFYAISIGGVQALFIGLFAGIMSVNEKRRTGALKVLLASPVSPGEMLAGETLAALLLVGVSSAAVVAASLAAGARYEAAPSTLLLVAAFLGLGTVFSVGVGLLLSGLAKTPETASALANMVAWPVMFVGGIIIPPDMVPESLRIVAEAWPLSRLLEASRKMLLYGASPTEGWAYALPAVAATVAVYLVGWRVFAALLERAQERV